MCLSASQPAFLKSLLICISMHISPRQQAFLKESFNSSIVFKARHIFLLAHKKVFKMFILSLRMQISSQLWNAKERGLPKLLQMNNWHQGSRREDLAEKRDVDKVVGQQKVWRCYTFQSTAPNMKGWVNTVWNFTLIAKATLQCWLGAGVMSFLCALAALPQS